jgi:uncharacterized FAD-dependent dehydrogenase
VPSESPSFLYRNLLLSLEEDEELLPRRLAGRLDVPLAAIVSCRIVRKGIDARKKPHIKQVYTVEFVVSDPEGFWRRHSGDRDLERLSPPLPVVFTPVASPGRIIVVGSGPAGLFAALRLAEYGLKPLLIERGREMAARVRDVEGFWQGGALDGESNIQFGEGGAGTFSDGKLTTRVRDPQASHVLARLVEFGAPGEIAWLAKPHIGTDRLRAVVVNLRRFLLSRGVEVRFGAKLTDLQISDGQLRAVVINGREELPCDRLLLAPGHSARDTYAMLHERGVPLEAKPFAVGLRVEHPQELINRIQYGLASHPRLAPADYALTFNDAVSGRSAYSFCMCPGGEVVACSSEQGGVVTNGMSSYGRNTPWANSALVATVRRDDFPTDSPLAGVEFQRELERRAFALGGGNYHAPCQNLLSFLGRKHPGGIFSTYRPGVREADLAELLPDYVTRTLRDGIGSFERKMRGFITAEATLVGVESRTSAPLRILRGDDCQSVGLAGLYPCGEGAGYAGGIMSAALDGIRVADAIAGGQPPAA